MRPLEGEGPAKKPITDARPTNTPQALTQFFHGLGKYSQFGYPQRADSRTGPIQNDPRSRFNYNKPEDRSIAETRDVNKGRSGLKRGMDMPQYVRPYSPDYRTEQQRSAIERRFRTTRNT